MINQNDPIFAFQPLWGEWTADKLLGEGSYGRVYRVSRKDIGGEFVSAVKHIRIPKFDAEVAEIKYMGMDEASISLYFGDIAARIVKEVRVMYTLRGMPNIVAYEDHAIYHEEGSTQWDIFIRMELLEPLPDYLAKREVSPADLSQMGIDLCTALAACAKKGIIHRDIKEGNVFVTEDGVFKLGDFGIARSLAEQARSMSMRGTPMYIAPEVFHGRHYDSRADIYSLGLLLYKLLNNGRYPFLPPVPEPVGSADIEEAFALRMGAKAVPPPANGGEALQSIVQKACSYDPAQRFQNAEEMKEALERNERVAVCIPARPDLAHGEETVALNQATDIAFQEPEMPGQAAIMPQKTSGRMDLAASTQAAAPQEVSRKTDDAHTRQKQTPGPVAWMRQNWAAIMIVAATAVILLVGVAQLTMPVFGALSAEKPYAEEPGEPPKLQPMEPMPATRTLSKSPGYTTPVGTWLRTQPRRDAPMLRELTRHTMMMITGVADEWLQVEADGQTGFVLAQDVNREELSLQTDFETFINQTLTYDALQGTWFMKGGEETGAVVVTFEGNKILRNTYRNEGDYDAGILCTVSEGTFEIVSSGTMMLYITKTFYDTEGKEVYRLPAHTDAKWQIWNLYAQDSFLLTGGMHHEFMEGATPPESFEA